MSQQQSHAHHYVPEWLQKRVLPPRRAELWYLDLKPEIAAVTPDGVEHKHRSLFHRAPKRCFYRDDLYMLRFGSRTTDLMERAFFGKIDLYGCRAAQHFAEYRELSDEVVRGFQHLVTYMGAQRFRTPRGLDDIQKRHGRSGNQNATLAALEEEFQAYATMWTEGVWEIVRARQSPTKFIVTDDPVTFYCTSVFRSEWE